jgi:hypothetical protein
VTAINWGAEIAGALVDVSANLPLAPGSEMTEADLAAALPKAQAFVAWLAAQVKERPGLIRAADRILTALQREDEPWAAKIKAALDALPGGLAEAEKYLPTAIWALQELSPGPTRKPTGIA